MTELKLGDCLEVLRTLPENSVDSVVTDPPYGLSTEPDIAKVMQHWIDDTDYMHTSKGFMGKTWDSFVPGPKYWRECYRVLKPGGHMLVFAGTRTQDLMGIALRFAGFEIRDCLTWLYGSGFPKSLDLSKAIDKAAGAEREKKQWSGWGTALKPASEPILLVRKPLSEATVAKNVLRWNTGALNINGCRIGMEQTVTRIKDMSAYHGNQFGKPGVSAPITGHKINPPGRFPANLLLDETAAAILDEQSGHLKAGVGASRFFYVAKASAREKNAGLEGMPEKCAPQKYGLTAGGALPQQTPHKNLPRTNSHPTVKPLTLMRYLCRLITPPGGTILDPFMGSGSTGCAAKQEGFSFIGIEREAEYLAIAEKRIGA